MIRILSIQEAYKSKIERQMDLDGLKFQCHGSCAYIGKDVSPGCYGCFHSDAYFCGFMLGCDVGLPNVCNRDCVYCFEPHPIQQRFDLPENWHIKESWKESITEQLEAEKLRITTECKMQYYDFTGVCEPLLYLPVIEQWMKFLRETVDLYMGTRGWAKLYTNGTLLNSERIRKLEEMGFDEVRIHLGASNFSKEVYDNIKSAVHHIPTVTVETPAWPPHRPRLFEMLPIIADMGVQHLDICQVEITNKSQLNRIEKALGDIEIYQAFCPMLNDGGLVEDTMREVLSKNYPYSVIDCNGFVKQSRSALTNRSYWNILNRKFPPEWQNHRVQRRL